MKIIKSHKELIVYQLAFKVSMEIFQITKSFPKEEVFSLTSQIRRSSRSVCSNLAGYERTIGMLVNMMNHPDQWSLKK